MKQDTRASLLRTGRRVFARYGYDGASLRAITSAARTNLGAVTYHFGSKRKFYEAVLASCAQPLADAAVAAAQRAGSCADRVSAVARAYFDYLFANPDVAQLMLQELVLGRTPPAAVGGPIRQIMAALVEIVEAGQRSGEFRAGDPRLMAISIISQPVHMNLVRGAVKNLMGINIEDARIRERVAQHITAFACAGLAVPEGN